MLVLAAETRSFRCHMLAFVPVCGLQRAVITWFRAVDFTSEGEFAVASASSYGTVVQRSNAGQIFYIQQPPQDRPVPDFPQIRTTNYTNIYG